MGFRKIDYLQNYNMAIEQKSELLHNHERAYAYYKEKFVNDYKNVNITGKKLYYCTYERYDITLDNYYFYNFKNITLGEEVALAESDYKTIDSARFRYNTFTECTIKNVVFKNCVFSGCSFYKVFFENAIFENCYFSIPVIEDGRKVEDFYSIGAKFDECMFTGKFINCNLECSIYDKCIFTLCTFAKSNLTQSVISSSTFCNATLGDCILCNSKIYDVDFLDIVFSNDKKTIVNEDTFIDYKIHTKLNKENPVRTSANTLVENFDKMIMEKSRTLLRISQVFEINQFNDFAGEYFYYSKLLQSKSIHGIKKIPAIFFKYICGYGERPSFSFYTIILVTFIFSILYMFTGFIAVDKTVDYCLFGGTPQGIQTIISDFFKSAFFSITTSTVGFANSYPIGVVSKILCGIHMLFNVGMGSLWTGCLFRKLSR